MEDIRGEDFYNVIKELGEQVTFTETGNVQYASLKPNMLNKAIGTTDGAYWFTGVMTFDNMAQQEMSAGSYFKRSTQPNVTCMLFSIFPENSTPHVAITHVVECNEKVDIISHYEPTGEYNEYGEAIGQPVYAARDVDVYITAFNKDARDTAPGAMEETITYMTIPAKYMLSNQNIILKEGFVFDEKTKTNKLAKIPHRIESINYSMMDKTPDGKYVGLLICMLKETQAYDSTKI